MVRLCALMSGLPAGEPQVGPGTIKVSYQVISVLSAIKSKVQSSLANLSTGCLPSFFRGIPVSWMDAHVATGASC